MFDCRDNYWFKIISWNVPLSNSSQPMPFRCQAVLERLTSIPLQMKILNQFWGYCSIVVSLEQKPGLEGSWSTNTSPTSSVSACDAIWKGLHKRTQYGLLLIIQACTYTATPPISSCSFSIMPSITLDPPFASCIWSCISEPNGSPISFTDTHNLWSTVIETNIRMLPLSLYIKFHDSRWLRRDSFC